MNIPQKQSQLNQTKLVSKKAEEIIELIQKIDKADNLASTENSKIQKDNKLQILPGYHTGIVSLLR